MTNLPQATLNDNILKDTPRRDIDSATLTSYNYDGSCLWVSGSFLQLEFSTRLTLKCHTPSKVDSSSNGKMIQFQNARDTWHPLLEVTDFFEVRPKLD